MAYTNSSLVSYTKLSPNHSGQRTHSIDRITPHCVVGQLSAESICGCFTSPSRQASCNYGIGTDGRISLCVEEKNRSWCSSSNANDQRAITIECASDMSEPYAMNDKVYASLISLCTDICKRNGKKKLLWLGDKDKTLNYAPKSDEMVITVHRWFANKSCPGNWLYARLGDLAAKVTANLGGNTSPATDHLYRVQVGAYKNKANADAQLAHVKAAGFDTYMVQIGGLYKIQVGAYREKTNADNMMTKLKTAGFDAFITTESGTSVSTLKSMNEIAREVIRGDWGNGADRRNRLISAGYDYAAVQASEELKLEVLFMQKETKAVLQATDIASHLKTVPISSIEIQQDYDYFMAQRASEALFSAGLISLVEFNKLTQLNRDTFSPMFFEIMPRIT